MKAGHLFKCVCCNEDRDESEAQIDEQFEGPVCSECQHNINKSVEYLQRFSNSNRPINKTDINLSNHHRFKNY